MASVKAKASLELDPVTPQQGGTFKNSLFSNTASAQGGAEKEPEPHVENEKEEMASVEAKASLTLDPVTPQQGGTFKNSLFPNTASAQGGAEIEPELNLEKEKEEMASVEAKASLTLDLANVAGEVVPQTPPERSFSQPALSPSSEQEQQWLRPDSEPEGDGETGSNLAPADVSGKHSEDIADGDLQVEPQSRHSDISSDEEGQFFSGPAPMDLQQCAAEVRALVAAGKVNAAWEVSQKEGEEEKEQEEEQEEEEEEDEEEAYARKMEELEQRLEDWDVYWNMPPLQKVQIRCLLGLWPFP